MEKMNLKRGVNNISIVMLGISLALHLFVYYDYQILLDRISLPEHWNAQFYLLLILSFVISIILVFLKKGHLGLIILKFLILLLAGYPLGSNLGIETLLLIIIVLESVYYLNIGMGVSLPTVLIVITFMNQKPGASWEESFAKADNQQLMFLLFVSFLVLFIAVYLKKVSLRVKTLYSDLNRMDYAVKELTDINLGYQNYVNVVEKNSIESERKRISREMHDIIGYTLTNQLMIIQAVLSMNHPLPDRIKSLLLESQKQTNDGMIQAREALHQLREFSADRESGIKLILKMIRTFEHVTGIKIDVDFGNVPDNLSSETQQVVYRLIQEGLTNAFRHGGATEISILLSISFGLLKITVWDNGAGAVNICEGIGLKGMRERLAFLNGTLETSSSPEGFSLRAEIPFSDRGDFSEVIIS